MTTEISKELFHLTESGFSQKYHQTMKETGKLSQGTNNNKVKEASTVIHWHVHLKVQILPWVS